MLSPAYLGLPVSTSSSVSRAGWSSSTIGHVGGALLPNHVFICSRWHPLTSVCKNSQNYFCVLSCSNTLILSYLNCFRQFLADLCQCISQHNTTDWSSSAAGCSDYLVQCTVTRGAAVARPTKCCQFG